MSNFEEGSERIMSVVGCLECEILFLGSHFKLVTLHSVIQLGEITRERCPWNHATGDKGGVDHLDVGDCCGAARLKGLLRRYSSRAQAEGPGHTHVDRQQE